MSHPSFHSQRLCSIDTPPAFITFGGVVVVASSRLVCGAGGVGEVGCSRCGVSLGDGFADVAVGLPVRLLAVAVAIVSSLAAGAAAACGFAGACCASCLHVSVKPLGL